MEYFLISLLFGVIAFCCTFIWSYSRDANGVAIASAIITCLVSWFFMWFFQPTMSISYSSWYWWLLIPVIIALVAEFSYCMAKFEDFSFLSWVPSVVFLLLVIGISIWSSGMTQADKQCKMLEVISVSDTEYCRDMAQIQPESMILVDKSLAKSVSDTEYCRDMAQIQPESMILVDKSLAKKYAEASLEQDPATGSVCSVGKLSIQNLNGTFNVCLANGEKKTLSFQNEQVYVAPLEHRDYFKWKKNKSTPGYIMISAMKQNVVYFVTQINSEPLHLRYIDSGCIHDWWKRYLRENGYRHAKFADHNLELDNNGRPFMIIPVTEYSVAYTCPKITKVIVMDVQTGDVREYRLNEVPKWIDRVYPSDLIERRISWWGSYQRGWWNSLFAQAGVRSQTPGIEQVYTNGSCYWYTGIQSGGADDGTSGFMLINTRTGKSKLYAISGVNEKATMMKISNYKINAANICPSWPLMYNIKNEPTYFATCKAESGEFMGYAFASVKYRNVCGVGKTVNEAYDEYSKSMRFSRAETSLEGKVAKDEKVFTVADITKENDNYYFLFNEAPGKEFSCPSDISLELKWTKIGDTVSVSYEEGTSNQVTLKSFDNKRLQL